jgi:pyridoxal phosphate enzyme (YggS family)
MLTSPQNSPADATTSDEPQRLTRNLAVTQARIAAAALRFGRPPQSVTLLAISKGQSAAALRAVCAAGQRDFGESYLQEGLDKIGALADRNPIWHYVGQIQSNKTRPIAEHFQWVHTVDRLRIAERLSEQRPAAAQPLNVCIQVKLAEEPGKGGASPADTPALANAIARLPQLRLRGLMCIPPPNEQFDAQLGYFRQCRALYDSLLQGGLTLDTLSMGMSGDLEAAIAAGATVVRVGTAIFGERTSVTREA